MTGTLGVRLVINFYRSHVVLLSVVIPTRNRARRVADLLDSLSAQNPVSFDWEVVVVDNASSDETPELTHSKMSSLPITIRHVVEPNLGLHNGRHRGAKEARGKYLAYLDDDMQLAPTWLRGVEYVASGQFDAVVGRILPKWEGDPPDWLLSMTSDGNFGYLGLLDLGPDPKPVDPRKVFGGNCFLARDLVYKLRGFHPDGMPAEMTRYRGDGETGFMKKFKAQGLISYYDPRATAYHIIGRERMTSEYLCRRALNQGISNSFSAIRALFFEQGIAKHALFDQCIETESSIATPCPHRDALPTVSIPHGVLNKFARLFLRLDPRIPWRFFLRYYRKTRQIFNNLLVVSSESRKRTIDILIQRNFHEGYAFHQNAVKQDQELLEWVLRDDYFDCCK